MGLENKKGVSPVVATVLLISVAIIVIIIIFIWATSTINEGQLKFGSPIRDSCNNLNIQLTLSGNRLDITNSGSRVPLHSVSIKVREGASTRTYDCGPLDISPGQSGSIPNIASCGVPVGGNVRAIVPIIKDDNEGIYYCSNNEITSF
ncbi:MAG: archaellin/type IV pilin N-terminal domain-containing protein [Candidatus Pacearchaeota archaeon]